MTNFLKKARNIGLALVITAGLTGCVQKPISSQNLSVQPKNIEARVGEFVDNGVLYAGMNSSSSFSLSYCGYTTSTGTNLYYPKTAEIINYAGKSLKVISVTSEKIVLQKLKN